MEEVWKDIVGYEGLYRVSNLGNVYSCYMNKTLSIATRSDKYKFVVLRKNGKDKYMTIHRLVAEAFIPNPDNLPMVNHKDENPSNNCVDNLEWCTAQYNATYNDAHIKRGESLCNKVYAYDCDGVLIKEYSSTQSVAKCFNMSNSNVSTACNSDFRTFNGMILSYVPLSREEVLNRLKNNKLKKYKVEHIGEYIKKTKSKKVNQYDLDMNFIAEYPSTREAGRQLGFSPSLIGGVCRKEHRQTHGYIFRYADDREVV